jgi:hypothetical protein
MPEIKYSLNHNNDNNNNEQKGIQFALKADTNLHSTNLLDGAR